MLPESLYKIELVNNITLSKAIKALSLLAGKKSLTTFNFYIK